MKKSPFSTSALLVVMFLVVASAHASILFNSSFNGSRADRWGWASYTDTGNQLNGTDVLNYNGASINQSAWVEQPITDTSILPDGTGMVTIRMKIDLSKWQGGTYDFQPSVFGDIASIGNKSAFSGGAISQISIAGFNRPGQFRFGVNNAIVYWSSNITYTNVVDVGASPNFPLVYDIVWRTTISGNASVGWTVATSLDATGPINSAGNIGTISTGNSFSYATPLFNGWASATAYRVGLSPLSNSLTLGESIAIDNFSAVTTELAPVNSNASTETREILNYLASIYGHKTLMGYNDYVHTPDIYQQTGRHAAIWGNDLHWWNNTVQRALDYHYIPTLHWHWHFNGESAWKSQRTNQVNVGAMVTPGTIENSTAIAEMSATATKLEVFKNAGVPVLFRPLHEIDGGWFWWTDTANPANTAALWRMMYDYFTNTRGLNNLIWVYSAGTGLDHNAAYRSQFYPGSNFVDIAGIDIYNIDYRNTTTDYKTYFDMMRQVAPGKMLALAEGDACPDPDKMASGAIPAWLYCMPWWGTPNPNHPVDWALHETRHNFMITLDELPYLGSGNIKPSVGIINPLDDGSGRFNNNTPIIEAFVTDRGGSIQRVDFLADSNVIGSIYSPPYTFVWNNPPNGLYTIQAVAVDNTGATTTSNSVRISTGTADLAFKQPIVISSGTAGASAIDGNLYSAWASDLSNLTPDDQWIYVDLGSIFTINQVHSYWGWKIHPTDYQIDVATGDPANPANWTTVKSVVNSPYVTWGKTIRDTFNPTSARYVRYHMTKRAGGQTWGGYTMTGLDVPVSLATFGANHAPVITAAASASPPEVWEWATTLSVGASDPDREVPTYTWGVVACPSGAQVQFTPNGTVFSEKTNATFTAAGTYTLRVTVADGRGGVATSDIVVVVHDITGGYAYLSDDRSSQSGNGLGAYETLSKYNRFAMRFVLPLGNVARAILRVYRKDSDTVPVTMYVNKGNTDQWNEVNGPVPGNGDLIGSKDFTCGMNSCGGWVEFDVTGFVAAEALGNGVATFVLTNNQNVWNTQVHSKQNLVNPPELTVTMQ